MDSDDKKIIIDAVQEAVIKTVNGKIDNLKEDICDMRADFKEHTEKIEPLLEGLQFFQYLVKFFKWVGLPITILFIPFYYWLKNL